MVVSYTRNQDHILSPSRLEIFHDLLPGTRFTNCSTEEEDLRTSSPSSSMPSLSPTRKHGPSVPSPHLYLVVHETTWIFRQLLFSFGLDPQVCSSSLISGPLSRGEASSVKKSLSSFRRLCLFFFEPAPYFIKFTGILVHACFLVFSL
jgi:hypothetical protein